MVAAPPAALFTPADPISAIDVENGPMSDSHHATTPEFATTPGVRATSSGNHGAPPWPDAVGGPGAADPSVEDVLEQEANLPTSTSTQALRNETAKPAFTPRPPGPRSATTKTGDPAAIDAPAIVDDPTVDVDDQPCPEPPWDEEAWTVEPGTPPPPPDLMDLDDADGEDAETAARNTRAALGVDPVADLRMVGRTTAADTVERILADTRLAEHRRTADLVPARVPRLCVTGHPGSGKTTLAWQLAGALHRTGALSRPWVTVVDPTDILAATADDSAAAVRRIVADADGTLLLIRRAHRLREAADQWSTSWQLGAALATLVHELHHAPALAVMLAGNPDPLHDLLTAHPELRHLFPHALALPTYSPADLTRRFHHHLSDRGYVVTEPALDAATAAFGRAPQGPTGAGAHAIDPFAQRVLAHQAARLTTSTREHDQPPSAESLRCIDAADVPPALRDTPATLTSDDALAELHRMVGLDPVKKHIDRLRAEIAAAPRLRRAGITIKPPLRHLVFTGAPGTAKTTTARLLAQICGQLRVLSSGHLVEVTRADLVGEYVGHTEQRVRSAIDRAQGGVLFIDFTDRYLVCS